MICSKANLFLTCTKINQNTLISINHVQHISQFLHTPKSKYQKTVPEVTEEKKPFEYPYSRLLTKEEIKKVQELRKSDPTLWSQRRLAAKFGVRQGLIARFSPCPPKRLIAIQQEKENSKKHVKDRFNIQNWKNTVLKQRKKQIEASKAGIPLRKKQIAEHKEARKLHYSNKVIIEDAIQEKREELKGVAAKEYATWEARQSKKRGFRKSKRAFNLYYDDKYS